MYDQGEISFWCQRIDVFDNICCLTLFTFKEVHLKGVLCCSGFTTFNTTSQRQKLWNLKKKQKQKLRRSKQAIKVLPVNLRACLSDWYKL